MQVTLLLYIFLLTKATPNMQVLIKLHLSWSFSPYHLTMVFPSQLLMLRSERPTNPITSNVMISEKPILRQTWSQDYLWPQCAFKKSMLKVSCNSH